MSLSEQIAAAWLVAVQTARICEDVSGHRHVLVDTSAILAVEAQLAEANKRVEGAERRGADAERYWMLLERRERQLADAERALAEARERDLSVLQADIGAWADHTFPSHHDPAGQPNPRGPIMHLTRPDKGEVWELVRAFEAGRPLNEEVADCITLLLTIAHLSGFSALEATRAKLAKNRQRQWGQPDPDGIVEHVQEEVDRG